MIDYKKNPQLLQSSVRFGLHLGEIVDNKDPEMRGRVRVWLYGLYGDFYGRMLSAVPWAKVSSVFPNGTPSPDLWDRAIVLFDCGNPDYPVVIGFWKANPSGAGTLPHNRTVGTETPPESWHHHSLTPEVTVVAKTGEGNAIWMEDKQINQDNVFSSVQIEDTGGKYIRMRSFWQERHDYTEGSQPNINNDLYKANIAARTPLRDGLSPDVLQPVPGAIEIGHQNVKRLMVTDDNTYSVDSMTQKTSDGVTGIEMHSMTGSLFKLRQAQAAMLLNNGATFFSGAVHIPGFLGLPRVY